MTTLVHEGAAVTLHRPWDVPVELRISVPFLLRQKRYVKGAIMPMPMSRNLIEEKCDIVKITN